MGDTDLLKEYIKELLSESNTRAAQSQAAGPAAEIILSNLDTSWSVVSAAKTGSNAIDLVLGNGSQEVNVEVKAYGEKLGLSFFKAEIKLPTGFVYPDDPSSPQQNLPLRTRSSLGQATDMEKDDYPATAAGIRRRVLDPDNPDQLPKEDAIAAIEAAVASPDAGYVSDKQIKLTKGAQAQSRYIYIQPGEPGDYERLRHQGANKYPTSKGRRELFSIGTSDVRDVGNRTLKENDPKTFNTIATGVRQDFSDDQYLALYNDAGKMRMFQLRGGDPLGLNAPLFDGSAIEKWKYATTGGGIRPGVGITVNSNSGVIVSRASSPRAPAPNQDQQSISEPPDSPTDTTRATQLGLQLNSIQRLRSVIRESLLMEELTGSDKSEIARIVRKEIDKDRAKQKKIARDEASAEIKDALGVSFFGVKGKINKFVVDAIRDEVSKMVNKGQTRDDIAQITKNVIKKLYKELAIAQAPVIDRIKV